jgi:hypothetical protein
LLNLYTLAEKKKESMITAIYAGAIFIVLALVYYIHLPSSLWNRLVDFISSFTLSLAPSTGIPLPVPAIPAAHVELYNAAFQFSLGLGILEIAILAIRILLHSPMQRKAETVENLVFWLGTSYLISSYLLNMTLKSEWFVFWAGVILISGLSLVARAFILFANR